MTKSIQHTLFFAHPTAAVWEYLTNAELMAQWLMKNDFQPVVGHEFQFRTGPLPKFDFDGIAYCKVLEIVPLKKLSYSWKGGPEVGKITLDSLVVWTLAEKEGGCELHLVHSGFKETDNFAIYAAMNDGWIRSQRVQPVHRECSNSYPRKAQTGLSVKCFATCGMPKPLEAMRSIMAPRKASREARRCGFGSACGVCSTAR